MVEPSTCLVDPTDILAQLFFAVGARDPLVVSTPHGNFDAVLRGTDDDGVAIVPTCGLPALAPGEPVCLEHVGVTDTYHFYSEVVASGGQEVRLRLPPAIELTERRLCTRVPVPPGENVYLRVFDRFLGVECPVYDLSGSGLAFEPPLAPALALGDELQGELGLPDGTTIPMCVQVRHLQARRDERRAGVRFTALSLAGRGRIARLLIDWQGA